ncbi:MAG: alpha/beta hydrolase [Betaproteobacteria bacterium]|nr:alpha/beta hydrolase [Betaproteobacteria bacterium]
MANRGRWWMALLLAVVLAGCGDATREGAPPPVATAPPPAETAPGPAAPSTTPVPPEPAPVAPAPPPPPQPEVFEYRLPPEEAAVPPPATKNGAKKKKKAARPDEAVAAAPAGETYGVVRVWFGTDRNDTGSEVPRERFGDDRGSDIRYGTVEVSIPPGHVKGELESPLVLRPMFETPEKHVVLLRLDVQDAAQYWAGLRSRLAAGTRNVLVFVHGYNTSFEDAAGRTAQIAWDVEFPGVPMFYSWPSRGTVAKYPHDETNVEWAQPNLRGFLRDIALNLNAEGVYLVAHSMGNRALTRAFIELGRELPAQKLALFKEVVLTAPDIDADVFRRDIAPQLVASGTAVTLYASSKDRALKASRVVHGKPRAGDSGGDLVVVRGMETVDASDIDTSLIGLGHTYVAESRPMLQDLFSLIADHKRAAQRFGLETLKDARGEAYWRFRR